MLYEQLKNNAVYIPEGVKKIYEAVIKEGRSLVINDFNLNTDMVPNGTLFIDASSSKMKIKKQGALVALTEQDVFDAESITGAIFKYDTIDANRIKHRSLTRDRIQHATITGDEIANSSVPGHKITFNTIETRHIVDDSIDTSHLKNNAVDGLKLAERSINDAHLIEDSVRGYHIRNGNIAESHLEPDCISSTKIQTDAVLAEHLKSANIIARHILDAQIQEKHLVNSSVTTHKIANTSVSSAKIQNNAITKEKILNNSIDSTKIINRSVGYTKLESVVEARIKSSLNVTGGVASLSILNATERLSTKVVNASVSATINALIVSNNATINGRLHSKGDITTDGKVYRVAYNDIAEAYYPGEHLEPGDIVEIREDGKVYKSTLNSKTVVGVYSDCFGDCFGASLEEIEKGIKVPIGLIGQIPVKLCGPVEIGDYIAIGENGIGFPVQSKEHCRIIGKALKTVRQSNERVLCLVYPD